MLKFLPYSQIALVRVRADLFKFNKEFLNTTFLRGQFYNQNK